MKKYVAFLRAINVAGHAIVRMSDLKDAFAAAGCRDVKTYIQSGNVVFDALPESTTEVFEAIRVELRELLGLEPGIMFRTARELDRIVAGAPFQDFEAEKEIKRYVTLLSRKPRSKPTFPLRSTKEALEALAMKNLEVFVVSRRKENGFFGFPNEFIEKELGVPATTRNMTTLAKIVDFACKGADE